ncbi:TadE/TadG family type IV pilus assembly protein [Consotaella salsifontis]|uniref:Flp pilus assembly protein TadG n=1 Tax=Consotaella salsifontis TaxID=1365950 RepID=A0A1T4S136_9HYPH|nr:TadE/TadG family type IV pilus assembly protein [Consotaella salsifontis]SKA21882.1 Flp pilus assembly protein TadG [Consotaella salsifontis]
MIERFRLNVFGLVRARLGRLPARFVADVAAVGAVEFALVAPFLLVLYLGGAETAIAVSINRKVHHAATAVNDLVTQSSTTLTAADVMDMMSVGGTTLQPYGSAPFGIKVTAVSINAAGEATAAWSCSRGMAKDAAGTKITLPAEFRALKNMQIVVSQTLYRYVPLGGYGLNTPIDMGETAYLYPRISSTIECADCAPASACTGAS